MKNRQNQAIADKLDTWLLFFASDKPEDVISIIENYPEFKAMYEDVYELCKNTEDVMELFSKELFELDKGTTKFMMDEMQEEIDELKEERDNLLTAVSEKDALITKLKKELQQLKK